MKVNAPEKIYFSQTEDGRQYFTPAIPFEREFVEYMPVDAFIEKAVEYMVTHISDMHTLGGSCKFDELIINDFKKYMKGE